MVDEGNPGAGAGTPHRTLNLEKARNPRAQIVGVVLGIALAFVTIAGVEGWIDYSHPWTAIGVVLGVAAFVAAVAHEGAVKGLRSAAGARLRRMDEMRASGFFWMRCLAGLVCYGLWVSGSASSPRIGAVIAGDPLQAGVCGFLLYYPLSLIFTAWEARRSGRIHLLTSFVGAMRLFMPRAAKTRALVWAALLANPLIEEFLFRGVLVKMLADHGAGVPVAILAGGVVHSWFHIYQGRSQAVFHLGFYAVAVALLYSPLGLWGCFGFHVAGDVLPMLLFRRNLRKLRKLRLERSPKASAAGTSSRPSPPRTPSTSPSGC